MKRLIVLVLVLGLSTALGQNLSDILDATEWMASMEERATEYEPGIQLISRAMFALAFVSSIIYIIATRAGAGAAFSLVIRTGAVILIFASVAGIKELTYASWNALRAYSMGELEEVFSEGSEEMRRLGEDTISVLLLTALPATGTGVAAFSMGKMTIASSAKRALALEARTAAFWMNACVIPIMFFVVTAYIIILLSALTVAFGNIFLPISAAMLMFSPAQGERWLGLYLSALLSALFIVALMPLAFGAAFDFAIVEPVRIINDNFQDSDEYREQLLAEDPPEELARLQTQIGENEAEIAQRQAEARKAAPGSAANAENLGAIRGLRNEVNGWWEDMSTATGDFYNGQIKRAQAALVGAGLDFRNMFLRLVLLMIGAALGSYFLFNASGIVTGLMGGIAFGIAGKLARPTSIMGAGGAARLLQGGRPALRPSSKSSVPALPATAGSAAVGPAIGGTMSSTKPSTAGYTGGTQANTAGATTTTQSAKGSQGGAIGGTTPSLEGSTSRASAPAISPKVSAASTTFSTSFAASEPKKQAVSAGTGAGGGSSASKDSAWLTSGEPATDKQMSYLKSMDPGAPDTLTKQEAHDRLSALKGKK